MALTDTPIEPAGSPAPASPPAPAESTAKAEKPTESDPGADLPKEVRANPVVNKVLRAEVPGVLFRSGAYYPTAVKLGKYVEDLLDVGMDFYKAFDQSFVFFNPRAITEAQLRSADEAGQLASLVPDYEAVSGEAPQPPPKEWLKQLSDLNAAESANILPGQQKTTPSANASPGGMPASSDAALAEKRAKNLLPGAPTTGPRPGAGRVQNALAKPVV